MTRSGEHIRTTSCRAICWVVGSLPVSFIPWGWISGVTAVVWVLDVVQVIVLGVCVAEMAVGVVSGVTVERRGLWCENGGWVSSWGSMS